MAVEFTGVVGQRIDYSTNANVYGLAQKSISFWINPDSVGVASPPAFIYTLGLIEEATGNNAWGVIIGYAGNGDIGFQEAFSVDPGSWYSGNILSTGLFQHVVITYSNSNTANDPIFYVNGVVKSITEDITPSGTTPTGNGSFFRIGAGGASTVKPIDGRLQDVRIYNRILSAAEVYALYANRRIGYLRNGLVFHAPMIGAAGLTQFDGATLGATNYVRDIINNAAGTPVGNPIGRGNVIERVN